MKLVFLGDSLTWGGYGGSYVEALRRLMPVHEIINAGEGGNTAINLLRRLESDVLSHDPDGVFVMVGGNDAISFSQPKTRSYYRQGQQIDAGFVTIDDFEAAYRELLTQLQLAQVLVWVGLPPIEYNPTVVETVRAYNERAREIARTFNVPVLDLMATFAPVDVPERPPLDIGYILTIGKREQSGWNEFDKAQREGGYSFTFDGMHLTPESAEQVAEQIAAFIRARL